MPLFLELFYDATVTLSRVYYHTSPLMIHYLVKIVVHLKNYANDVHIRSVVQPMIDKYNKYWRDIPLLYSFAFILDPRSKMKGFTRVLRRLGISPVLIILLIWLALELDLLMFTINMMRNMVLLG